MIDYFKLIKTCIFKSKDAAIVIPKVALVFSFVAIITLAFWPQLHAVSMSTPPTVIPVQVDFTNSTSTTVSISQIDTSAYVAALAVRGNSYQVVTTTTIPPLRMWEGPLPAHYGGDTNCTKDQASIIARAFWFHNASDDTVLWALNMISRESTCDSSAHNNNSRTGDDSWGLCQINALAGHFSSKGIVAEYDRYSFATNFQHNAEACAKLWSVCGRGPWNYGNYYCKQPTS
jgi:hypothetical protein